MARFISKLIARYRRHRVVIVPFGFVDPRIRAQGVIPFGFTAMIGDAVVGVFWRHDVRDYMRLPTMFGDMAEGIPKAVHAQVESGFDPETETLSAMVQRALGARGSLRVDSENKVEASCNLKEFTALVNKERTRINERLRLGRCSVTLIASMPNEPQLFQHDATGVDSFWSKSPTPEGAEIFASKRLSLSVAGS